MHEFHKTSLSFFTIHICFQLFVFCRSRYLCVSYNTLILKISKFPIVHRFFFYSHYYLCVENPFLSRKRGSPLSSISTSIVADSRATRQLPDGIDVASKVYHVIEMFAIYYIGYVIDKFPFILLHIFLSLFIQIFTLQFFYINFLHTT